MSGQWPDVPSLKECDWSLFRNVRISGSASAGGALAQRYRLAGTYILTVPEAGTPFRKAIIDNMQTKVESIVAEGERLDNVEVVQVLEDSVILRENGIQVQLSLMYTKNTGATGNQSAKLGTATGGNTPVSTNAFGAYMGEGRWVMNRDSFLQYIEGIKENPTRMSQLFDSMVPVYDNNGGQGGRRRVGGYRLQMAGEQAFYQQVGLQEGDVVRRVNELPMSSEQRAMYLINQFRENKANTFIMDIERGGKPMRLEYIVR